MAENLLDCVSIPILVCIWRLNGSHVSVFA